MAVPELFEVRDAMERLDEFQQDCFEQWCGHYGYNLATEDPHLLVSYFQDSPMHGWLCGRRKNPMWRRTTWSIRVSLPTIHS